ncbi:MAG: helix-turn-helix transcriptional regulator [Planctomycetota bacterium]
MNFLVFSTLFVMLSKVINSTTRLGCEMRKSKLSSKSLSPRADRFIYLMNKLAGGSQRNFAGLLGCSQAVISKIVNGEQEPGPHLIRLVRGLPGVDVEWLETGDGEPLVGGTLQSAVGTVPMARKLIPGSIAKNRTYLTGCSVNVPATIATTTVYGIEAGRCATMEVLGEEFIRISDILIVESDPSAWRFNVGVLDNRLVIACLHDKNLCICRTSSLEGFDDRVNVLWPAFRPPATEKQPENASARRLIDFYENSADNAPGRRDHSDNPIDTGSAEPGAINANAIPVDAIVGLVLQLIRLY